MRQALLSALALLVSFTSAAFVARATETAASPRTASREALVKLRPRVPQFPADVKARGDRLWNESSPAVKSWARQNAPGVATGAGEPESLARGAAQARWPNLRAAGAPDVLAFLLLYETARGMQTNVKNKLDSLSEMSEMESLRLQMAMDRLSKMMSTLSNLLKKLSDTSSSITQNLK